MESASAIKIAKLEGKHSTQNIADHTVDPSTGLSPAEVAELEHGGLRVQQQVLGLDVPVADPKRVDVGQTPEQLVHVQLHPHTRTHTHRRSLARTRTRAADGGTAQLEVQSWKTRSRGRSVVCFPDTLLLQRAFCRKHSDLSAGLFQWSNCVSSFSPNWTKRRC